MEPSWGCRSVSAVVAGAAWFATALRAGIGADATVSVVNQCAGARSHCDSSTARRVLVATGCLLLGFVAHVVAGGGTDFSCAPLLVAAFCGVVATLVADQLSGYERRLSVGVVGSVALGQLLMHVVLSESLMIEARVETGAWGLTCRVVMAQAVAAGLLVVIILAAQRLVDLPTLLIDRARAWFWDMMCVVVAISADEGNGWHVTANTDEIAGSWAEPFVALVVCRRGPPVGVLVG